MSGPTAPSPFATEADWTRFFQQRARALPAWHFDRELVAELAAQHLPRVLAQIGLGPLLGRVSPHARLIVGRGAPFGVLPLEGDGPWMMFRVAPDARELLVLHEESHAWRCPQLSQFGEDLVDLGAWRWGVSPSKAAFRISRMCGRARPVIAG